MITLQGSCRCGATEVTVSQTPLRVGLCHCLNCRKEVGGPFKHFAVLPVAGLEVTGPVATWEDHRGEEKNVCGVCGTPVFTRAPEAAEIDFNVGLLEEPGVMPPTYELWTIRREPWLPDLGLVTYSRDRPAEASASLAESAEA